jgi:polar amino acid transport system substrate-binding protein
LGSFILAVGFATAGAATLQQIKQRGYMMVATNEDDPPFEYHARPGFVGYDNDLLAALKKQAGFEIRQEVVPWQDILPGVKSGKYDVALTAAAITRTWAKSLDFTMPIAAVSMAYIELSATESRGTVVELSRKTLGVQQGAASYEVLANLRTELRKSGGKLGKVIEFRSYAEAYEALVETRVDAVINNRDSLAQLVSRKSGLFRLGETIGPKYYLAWAVKKGNRDLLEFLNSYLAAQKANGGLRRMQAKYQLSVDDLPEEPLLPGGVGLR